MKIHIPQSHKDYSAYVFDKAVKMMFFGDLQLRAWFASEREVHEAIRMANAAGHSNARADRVRDKVSSDGRRLFAFTE